MPRIDAAAIRTEFDRLAAFETAEAYHHAEVYFPWLLRQLPARLDRVVEIGCGGGRLTTLLAAGAGRLLAIDLSPAMLDLAGRRCQGDGGVTFLQADAGDWRPEPGSLDAIVSVATLHHLDAARVLPRWAAALRPGGVLLILDVLDRPGLRYAAVNALAAVAGGWSRWRRSGRFRSDLRIRHAWADHAAFDRLWTPDEARRQIGRILPGARLRHHLLWRYSIRYDAPHSGGNSRVAR